MRVTLVDIGSGNLRSVHKALEAAAASVNPGLVVERTHDPERVRRAERLVMPGQGSFGSGAAQLADGLGEALLEALRTGTPYLGICLGLQLLFEGSEEAPGAHGLGWLPGRVERLREEHGIKIPHMGWSAPELAASAVHPLLAAIDPGSSFYFVHSFHAVPSEPALRLASVAHGSNDITAVVGRDHVFATQFHPEKSQRAGLALLAAFLRT